MIPPNTHNETVKQGYGRGIQEVINGDYEAAQATFAAVATSGEGSGGEIPNASITSIICKTLADAAHSLSNFGGERSLKAGQNKATTPKIDASGIAIYPNPTADYTTVILPKKLCKITVYDIHGKQVFEKQAAESLDISTNGWRDGIYFIQIEATDGSQRAVRKKLLVQKL